jgi:hypothetical protein
MSSGHVHTRNRRRNAARSISFAARRGAYRPRPQSVAVSYFQRSTCCDFNVEFCACTGSRMTGLGHKRKSLPCLIQVRSAAKSGHRQIELRRQLWANRRHGMLTEYDKDRPLRRSYSSNFFSM